MNRHLSSTVNPVVSYVAIGTMVIIFLLIAWLAHKAMASESIFTDEQSQIAGLNNN
jgi:hypothetical protein